MTHEPFSEGGRDGVLVCAEEPLRSALSELARSQGYEPWESTTLLQAIEVLLDERLRIRHALISSTLPDDWGRGLHAYLGDAFPHVSRSWLTA